MAKTSTFSIRDIRPITDFQRNAKTHVARLRKTKTPMVLTVNGSAAVVVQDADTYQKLLDHLEELEYERGFVAAVNEGIAAAKRGDVYPAREALAKLGRELGF